MGYSINDFSPAMQKQINEKLTGGYKVKVDHVVDANKMVLGEKQ